MKRRWILVPVTAGLLALMVAGGAVLAQGNGHPGGGGYSNGLASRVAEILNLDEATVQSAFNQAHREGQDERLQSLLDRMVSAEKLTRDDANAIMEWYQGRPDAAIRLPGMLVRGGDLVQRRLERMVRAGVITEAEAEEVLAWLEERPQDLPAIGPSPRGKHPGFHRGPMRRNNGGNGVRSFFGGPPQRDQDNGNDGSFRLLPHDSDAPSSSTSGVFY